MPFETCLNCLARWRLWIRPVVIFIYALAALVFVPLFLVKSLEDGFNKRDQEILIAGIFVWVAIPLSLWEIIQHVIHYTQPKLQKHIIRQDMLQHKRFQQDKEISTCLFVPNGLSTIYHFYHGYCKLILLTLFLPFQDIVDGSHLCH